MSEVDRLPSSCESVAQFNAALLEWLARAEPGATLGSAHSKTMTTVQLGDERCELRGGSTREGVRAYLARALGRRGDFAVVKSTKGVVHRVSLGDSLERIPGFYLYTSTAHDHAKVIASRDGDPFDMIDLHLKFNQALAHLHATGHQRLRVYPAAADLGLRFNVLLAEDMVREDEAWRARPVWRWNGGDRVGDLPIRPSTPVSEIALAMIADAEDTGIGTDWSYGGWYAEVVATAVSLRSVPRFEGGWRLVPVGIHLPSPPPPTTGLPEQR